VSISVSVSRSKFSSRTLTYRGLEFQSGACKQTAFYNAHCV
jgi:hypothetical protein